MNLMSLNNESKIPKYKQIVSSIEEAIAEGSLKKDDKLPSLNAIKDTFKLSRDTVLMAFNELKNRGIIHSVVGKGYYVSSENIAIQQKIFVLFDELNSFKEDLYNAFLENLGNHIQVEIYFHHFNATVFSKLILENVGNYNYYAIMPANLPNTHQVIANLLPDKVFILDQTNESLSQYPAIYQNFEKNVYEGLLEGLIQIKKYKKLVLIYTPEKQPYGILNGFTSFCTDHEISYIVLESLKDCLPRKGEIYLVLDDKNLIRIIKKIKEQSLEIASDIGIISYNDTLLKEVVAEGITTISTDFTQMGATLATMIVQNSQQKIENPSKLILRKSL
ncbi:GntR family transcriptional regulator [Polaribacter sp. BAL334]|nr:GntR family transcriptional regulator [Polaribacter sp. BAL334]